VWGGINILTLSNQCKIPLKDTSEKNVAVYTIKIVEIHSDSRNSDQN
jgi:hypothetical protein